MTSDRDRPDVPARSSSAAIRASSSWTRVCRRAIANMVAYRVARWGPAVATGLESRRGGDERAHDRGEAPPAPGAARAGAPRGKRDGGRAPARARQAARARAPGEAARPGLVRRARPL